ncbi:MAG: MFS transporter [Spirochaetes bacterium GWD1_27_9]|nr:MAG: MFS transporter [Spirochaetes bacterium GWC1_27_15]OHD30603.1 MAG: MFS transporter [Spirochaetes bacterium GWD1_27_9]
MDNYKKKAMFLIILFGLVSLFGDITYEGARSVNGQFLKVLGADIFIVGLIAGLGEFLGYALRLLSGYFADRTKAYWTFTFIGYGLLVSVPLLSLTGFWQIAAILIVTERLGKALRSPAKDTILSLATKQVGTGFGFGLHEAMDQIGAIIGPVIFTFVLFLSTTVFKQETELARYQIGYSFLWIPVILVIISVFIAKLSVPNPEQLEEAYNKQNNKKEPENLTKIFWIYSIFTFFIVLGFAHFAILAFHFKNKGLIPDAQIPLFYAIAMGVDGLVALIIGKVYDKIKLKALITIPILTIPIPILAFGGTYPLAVASIILWGVVMGIHETIVKAAIADLTPLKKRGTGYGIFNTVNGIAFFVSSAVIGLLYKFSFTAIIIFAVATQIIGLALFFVINHYSKKETAEA